MLFTVKGMQDKHREALFKDVEKIEHGTLQIEGVCCVIANYRKTAETVASLAKDIRENLYLYNDEMVTLSIFNSGFGKEWIVSKEIVDALLAVEDNLREMQKIVADEENEVVELITKEMEVTVAVAMCLAGLRKMIDISTEMVGALVYIMQVTNNYVDIFWESRQSKMIKVKKEFSSEEMKKASNYNKIKCQRFRK